MSESRQENGAHRSAYSKVLLGLALAGALGGLLGARGAQALGPAAEASAGAGEYVMLSFEMPLSGGGSLERTPSVHLRMGREREDGSRIALEGSYRVADGAYALSQRLRPKGNADGLPRAASIPLYSSQNAGSGGVLQASDEESRGGYSALPTPAKVLIGVAAFGGAVYLLDEARDDSSSDDSEPSGDSSSGSEGNSDSGSSDDERRGDSPGI